MIAVTGLMRSGTTPLAIMLHNMGVTMGVFQRFPTHNEHAHFEWEDSALAEPLFQMLAGLTEEVHVRMLFINYIAQRRIQARDEAWGVKTPFLMPYLTKLRRVCKELGEPLTVILTEREYSETLDSLERQSSHLVGDELERVKRISLRVQGVLAEDWNTASEHAEIFRFKDTEQNPLAVAQRLADIAGVELNGELAIRGIHAGR